MFKINDTERFGIIVANALLQSADSRRWQNAIAKAVVQIEENGDFMHYDETENYLLIWSQDSNKIYSANGHCQCEAFKKGFPCFHRAAARLIRLYLGLTESAAPKFPAKISETATPYLKPSTNAAPIAVGRYRI